MRRIGSLWRDRSGLAAVEMALLAPFLAVLALLSFEVWQASGRSADMRTALQTGAEYYMNGGSNDVAARDLALSSWRARPAGAEVSVSRTCACGETAHSCTSLCPDSSPPAALVILQGAASTPNVMFNRSIADERVVRVR